MNIPTVHVHIVCCLCLVQSTTKVKVIESSAAVEHGATRRDVLASARRALPSRTAVLTSRADDKPLYGVRPADILAISRGVSSIAFLFECG